MAKGINQKWANDSKLDLMADFVLATPPFDMSGWGLTSMRKIELFYV